MIFDILSSYIDEKYIIYNIISLKEEYENIELYNSLMKDYKTMMRASLCSKRIMNINFIEKYINEINFEDLARNKYLNDEIINHFDDKLDWDLLSLVYHFSDDMVNKYYKRLNMKLISIECLSIKTIERFKDEVNWTYLLLSNDVTKKNVIRIINHYKDTEYINWDTLSNNKMINGTFLNKFKNYLNWNKISKWFGFSKNQLKRFKSKINWDLLSNNNSKFILNDYESYLDLLNLTNVIRNNYLTFEEIQRIIYRLNGEDLIYIYQNYLYLDENQKDYLLDKINELF
jgi:hypothetical protein